MYTIYEGHLKSCKPLQERVAQLRELFTFFNRVSFNINTLGPAIFMHCNSLTEYACILVPQPLLYNTDYFQTGNQEGMI